MQQASAKAVERIGACVTSRLGFVPWTLDGMMMARMHVIVNMHFHAPPFSTCNAYLIIERGHFN